METLSQLVHEAFRVIGRMGAQFTIGINPEHCPTCTKHDGDDGTFDDATLDAGGSDGRGS